MRDAPETRALATDTSSTLPVKIKGYEVYGFSDPELVKCRVCAIPTPKQVVFERLTIDISLKEAKLFKITETSIHFFDFLSISTSCCHLLGFLSVR